MKGQGCVTVQNVRAVLDSCVTADDQESEIQSNLISSVTTNGQYELWSLFPSIGEKGLGPMISEDVSRSNI